MSDFFPLIVDGSGTPAIKEIPSGDVLDLTGVTVKAVSIDTTLAVTGNTTLGGTLGVTGVVTANAGINVDNINIDGTTIGLSTGDLLLDVAGDINLDADGGDINFKDGGTEFVSFQQDGGNVNIRQDAQDKDIRFVGNDGGLGIEALVLDMSYSGSAIFNKHIFIGDNNIAYFGAGNDLKIYHSSDNNSYIEEAGSGSLVVKAHDLYIQNAAGSENMALFAEDGAVTLYHNNSAKLTTTSTGATTTGLHTSTTSANISQVAITSSSNAVAWDARAAANAYYLTTESTIFAAPTNAVEGAIISVEIAQGGTPYTVAWNSGSGGFEFAASTAPTVTATANKTDIFGFRFNGSCWQEVSRVQNLAQT